MYSSPDVSRRTDPWHSTEAQRTALNSALSRAVVKRSLAVMLVVGTVLNGINQGDVFLSGGAVNWGKALLTYCVPFLVSTYGAYSASRVAAETASLP